MPAVGEGEAGVVMAGEVHWSVGFVADAEEGDGVGAVGGGDDGRVEGMGAEAGYFCVGGGEEGEEDGEDGGGEVHGEGWKGPGEPSDLVME